MDILTQFPNYFIVIGPNATASSWGWTLGRQSTAIARIVRDMVEYRLSSVQPTRTAYDLHNTTIQAQLENCVSGVAQYCLTTRVPRQTRQTIGGATPRTSASR